MTCVFLGFPEIAKIWASASHYLSQQLALHQAVRIPGLGTFTVVTEQVANKEKDIVTVERPVFHLAKAIVHNNDLRYDYIDVPGYAHFEELPYAQIASENNVSESLVRLCIERSTRLFRVCIEDRQNIAFLWRDIGMLIIEGKDVKMKFYEDFLEKLNGTTDTLEALLMMPEMNNSVISHLDTAVSQTTSGCVIVFPMYKLERVFKKPRVKVSLRGQVKPIKEEKKMSLRGQVKPIKEQMTVNLGGEVKLIKVEKTMSLIGQVKPSKEEKTVSLRGQVKPSKEGKTVSHRGQVKPIKEERTVSLGGEVKPSKEERTVSLGGEVKPSKEQRTVSLGGKVKPSKEQTTVSLEGQMKPSKDEDQTKGGERGKKEDLPKKRLLRRATLSPERLPALTVKSESSRKAQKRERHASKLPAIQGSSVKEEKEEEEEKLIQVTPRMVDFISKTIEQRKQKKCFKIEEKLPKHILKFLADEENKNKELQEVKKKQPKPRSPELSKSKTMREVETPTTEETSSSLSESDSGQSSPDLIERMMGEWDEDEEEPPRTQEDSPVPPKRTLSPRTHGTLREVATCIIGQVARKRQGENDAERDLQEQLKW
ncbi:coiled-coil domain-containing protein 81-like [Anas acuta]|uniref:coiled-coil domain-containing protein 81-like n=1 Tax=Anas acuta TaxID=28680 RepID=UPI0035C93834